MLPNKLQVKIDQRIRDNSFRNLGRAGKGVDFSSNDYLGFSRSERIFTRASEILKNNNLEVNGATGSRLLSGNHLLYNETEQQIATFHKSDAALIFNSGYDANLGFFGCVPQRGDIILYDELCHASIRDGIKMSNAKSYKFKHNDVSNLEQLLNKRTRMLPSVELPKAEGIKIEDTEAQADVYIVTESVFSMDGDQPDLKRVVALCKKHKALLIIDEAHAVGVVGEKGEGLVHKLALEKDVFARIVTFGKALGCHGAAVLGGQSLRNYLVNFARSFIYTTGVSPHAIATIQAAYHELNSERSRIKTLNSNIAILRNTIREIGMAAQFVPSQSAIHSCVVPGNIRVKNISEAIKQRGFDVKPILSPTVPEGEERLRICLHAYNSKEEIEQLLRILNTTLVN